MAHTKAPTQAARKADLAKQGTSRTLSVQSGTATGDSDAKLLRKALEEVARNVRSMKPSAFARYSTVLNAPAVRGLAGKVASDLQLQKAAHDALNAAIARLPTDTDKLIAKAVLADTEDFEDSNEPPRVRWGLVV